MRVLRRAHGRVGVVAQETLLVCLLLAWCPCAFGLNPALDVSQYGHTAWRFNEGFSTGQIIGIAQTPDGYLWLGTEFGLLRFDGVRTVPWQPPAGRHLPDNFIRGLLVSRDGTLWIGTLKGLATWKAGKLTEYPELAGRYVDALIEDREGTVWVTGTARPTGRLCAIQNGRVECYGQDGSLGPAVESLYEDSRGNLWVGAATGLWRWKPGPPQHYPASGPVLSLEALIEDDKGVLLISGGSGMRQLVDGRIQEYRVPDAGRNIASEHLLRDRDGGLWMGSFGSLVHVHEGRTDTFGQTEGLSGDRVGFLFEDREGSIWAVTSTGLDRFRDVSVATFSARQGLSNGRVGSVVADRDGSVWLGTAGGLNRWNKGHITIPSTGGGNPDGKFGGLNPNALLGDSRGRIWVSTQQGIVGYLESDQFVPVRGASPGVVRSIAEDTGGSLWFASQDAGLVRVSPAHDVQPITWAGLGHKDFAVTLAADAKHGGLWLGFYQGGIAYLADGQVRASYAAANGLGKGFVADLRLDQDGALWAATEGGLSRVKNGRVVTLTSKSGLPCDTVHWSMPDDGQYVWLYMACGLVRIARSELDAWAAALDRTGAATETDAKRAIHAMVFDRSDGVGTVALPSGYSPRVAKSSDGRLWFVSADGVSVIDPSHTTFNTLPPPVHVEQITADSKTYGAEAIVDGHTRLPALTRDLQIDYTALSLVVPEKNRFRYKLEGWDRDWQDVGTRRQAFYNNLPPRSYRFRVIASNNSGVWNETGATLDFSIAPAYHQTAWFRAASVIGVLALLWAAYQYRVRQVAAAFDARLQERVNERTRIARDLHDTLLQSFHGLLFRFQAATNKLSDSPVKQEFETAIDQAAQAITEGRDAVQNLRTSTVVTNDLAEAIGTLGAELAAAQTSDAKSRPTVVDVAVEGTSRDLHPIIRDDIYRIAGEALRNAFRHAHARHIEVRIRYDDAQLQVRVRDDGTGIDPAVRDQQKPGHFGLPGMRERADLVGAHLTVWSEVGLGTEVELTIPAAAAYATPRGRARSWLFVKRAGTSS